MNMNLDMRDSKEQEDIPCGLVLEEYNQAIRHQPRVLLRNKKALEDYYESLDNKIPNLEI